MFFLNKLLKGHDPSYPVLKSGDNYPSSNQDMTQNVILYCNDLQCHVKVNNILQSPTHTTDEQTREV